MLVADTPIASGWRAELDLRYELREGRTVLAGRRHEGPLVVQKPLYPEGDAVCHTIVVHPPAGLAGGDELHVRSLAGPGAHALLTTPGAGKWYRSAGAWAHQRVAIEASAGAAVEWVPQETIVFDGALAALSTEVRLEQGARYLGWEILCLGRTGSGERFTRGSCRLSTNVWRGEKLLWRERGKIDGGSPVLGSPAGLGGRPVCGTFLASAPEIEGEHVEICRTVAPAEGDAAVTRLPGVLIARYLGHSSEAARRYFAALRTLLRPALLGRDGADPRIWRT